MFNLDKFTNANFERRTEVVPVGALQDFFPKDEEAVFKVQGLTHSEIAECAEKIQSQGNLKTVLEAAAGHKPSIKSAIGEIIESKLQVPIDTQKRILHLVKGSVEPKFDEMSAVKLSETFPVEFTELTNKILELSGKGQVSVKKQ